jgi:LPXTG-site transpeptidase (sortase) family protein
MKKYLIQFGRIILVLVAAAIVFAFLNFGYIWDNINYWLHKPTPAAVVEQVNYGPPNRLKIASLNLDLPIVYADKVSESDFQEDLKSGVVHYPNTAIPGNAGDVYIFGHSSDFVWVKSQYKTAFATLPYMQIGDSIDITDSSGKSFEYVVFDKQIVSPKDTQVLAQDLTQHLLTLQTSYPIGTALKRYLVIAKLK